MRNLKVILPLFSASLMVIGFFLILGMVGALEVDNVGMKQAFYQCLKGAGMFAVGFFLLKKGGF